MPTPRSSRASVGGSNLNTTQNLNVTAVSAKSKSPSNFVSRNLQLAKPPPAPTNQTPSQLTNGRTGRVPLSYGGQRSATTSIVQTKSKLQTAASQQPPPKMPQQSQMSRTSTNQSISSNSTSTTTSATSPSSSSSMSASSSIHQIAPLNASSPRSRNHSPSSLLAHLNVNNSNATTTNPNKIISPSGLFTDGPLARRPVVNASPLRDRERSNSPLRLNQMGSQSNIGSNSNLHTIQETRIPSHLNSPMTNRKMQQSKQLTRKSFLPQPVTYSSSQQQRQSSISPIRNRNLIDEHYQSRNMSPSWKDGCF